MAKRWLGWWRRSALAVASLLMLASAACGQSASATVTLKVFAATSLTQAFQTLGTQFHQMHPNVNFSDNFAGSNTLATQITQGAPADIFASANQAQMDVVIQGGEVTKGTDSIFVHNRLVVITPKNNPANIQRLQDLARSGVKIVLAAKAVPVGAYALTFLQKASADPSFGAGYSNAVLANVRSYEQDVGAVLTKVQLGEADAGIVYTSDVATNANTVNELTIPDQYNVIADYPIAVLRTSPQAALANQFVQYVLSAQGQAVLAQDGFITVNG
jgi:molybdate transport system substrate-binding protein